MILSMVWLNLKPEVADDMAGAGAGEGEDERVLTDETGLLSAGREELFTGSSAGVERAKCLVRRWSR